MTIDPLRRNATALLTFAKSNVDKSHAEEGDDVFQNLWLGCTIAALSNVVIAAGLNVQKYTHMKLTALASQSENNALTPQNQGRPPTSVSACEQQNASTISLKYYRFPLWWLGITFMVLGEGGNFVAYGVAPASAIAPLGITCVIANVAIARIFLKETLRATTLIGSFIGVSGAVLLVLFIAKENDTIFDPRGVEAAVTQPSFVLYLTGLSVALVVLFLLYYVQRQRSLLVILFIANILAAITVISAKAVSGFAVLFLRGTLSLLGLITQPVLYFLVLCVAVTGITQVKYVQDALAIYPATFVVPVNYILFTLSAITAGIIFYGELLGLGEVNVIIFIIGCVLCFAGVFLITDDGRACHAMAAAGHGCMNSGSGLELSPTYGGTGQVTATTAGGNTGPNTAAVSNSNRVVTLLRDCVKTAQAKFELQPLLHSSPATSQHHLIQQQQKEDIEMQSEHQQTLIADEKMATSQIAIEPSPISKHVISISNSGMALMSPAHCRLQDDDQGKADRSESTVVLEQQQNNLPVDGKQAGSPRIEVETDEYQPLASPRPTEVEVETMRNISIDVPPREIGVDNEVDMKDEIPN